MSDFSRRLFRMRLRLAGCVAVACFAVLAGRFWHPYYGFTKFIQLDELDARNGIHEVRENPVFAIHEIGILCGYLFERQLLSTVVLPKNIHGGFLQVFAFGLIVYG